MKRIIFILLFFIGSIYSQDSIKVAMSDWIFVQNTCNEIESSLTSCQKLNDLYDKLTKINRMEILDLRQSLEIGSEIILKREQQLDMRQDQIRILKDEMKNKNIEIWIHRIGSGLILLLSVAIAI